MGKLTEEAHGEVCRLRKRHSRVDSLMRKNKTILTAHHFPSARSDGQSHSFPARLFVFAGTPSKCPLSPFLAGP